MLVVSQVAQKKLHQFMQRLKRQMTREQIETATTHSVTLTALLDEGLLEFVQGFFAEHHVKSIRGVGSRSAKRVHSQPRKGVSPILRACILLSLRSQTRSRDSSVDLGGLAFHEV
jgi:hypothetical protein